MMRHVYFKVLTENYDKHTTKLCNTLVFMDENHRFLSETISSYTCENITDYKIISEQLQ